MTTDSFRNAPASVDRLQRNGGIAAVLGLVLCALGWFMAPDYFFRGYLVGWVFWVGVSLGCMAICMVGHLSGGDWAVVSRRILEAASRVLPLMLVLFVPIVLGLPRLYQWAHPELIKTDHVVALKAPFFYLLSLSTTLPLFFYLRQILYFAIWIGLAWRLSSLSLRQDRTGDPSLLGSMRVVSAPGLIIYCLSITFASVDWLMSLQIHWFSTIFGFYLIASEALAAFAFLIVIAVLLSRSEPLAGVFQPRHFHDWGKFLFAFVMIWTYFSWSQFLITWAGNLPTEIAFFLPRINGGFGWVALAIVVFHFTVPFALLLSRDLKRNGKTLALVALCLLIMRVVELFWQVEPAFPAAVRHASMDWQYIAGPLFIGGLWLLFFARTLKSRPLLPINDPYLPEAIAHGHAHH